MPDPRMTDLERARESLAEDETVEWAMRMAKELAEHPSPYLDAEREKAFQARLRKAAIRSGF